MTYTKDANAIAAEAARAEERERDQYRDLHVVSPDVLPRSRNVKGDLTVFQGYHEVVAEYRNVTLDATKPGLILAYHDDGDVVILAVTPGQMMLFEPHAPR